MRFSARHFLTVLFTILSLSVSLCAQSTNKVKARVPRGSISGRVTIKDKGVPGVAIGLRKSDGFTALDGYQTASTDQDGFYRLANIAPGSYSMTVCAPAFVALDTFGKQRNVLVAEDETVEGINFELGRGSVITGRVIDADERPVIDQQVNVYQAAMFDQKGQRTVYAVGSVQTDDRGIYRVYGLLPGRYKVAVGRSDNGMNVTYNQARNVFYKQVFHPNVTDQTKATIVEVGEGAEANNIDITVGRTVQTFTVSGRVIDDGGLPAPGIRFGVGRLLGERLEYTNNSAASNSRGEFTFEGLVPGKYSTFTFTNQNSELRMEPLTFDVLDHDVKGLTVKLTKGISISGVVILENGDKAVLAQLLQLQLRAFGTISLEGGATFASPSLSPLGPDGSFRVSGLPPGVVRFLFAATGNPLPPRGFTITHIERDGITVSPRGLEVKDGEQLVGVRVFVAFGSATLRGVVTFENGLLPENGRIFVRVTEPGEKLTNLRPVVVDQRGRFLMEGIPAGTYTVQVSVSVPGQPARTIKREVTLQDGQTTEVTINIDSEP